MDWRVVGADLLAAMDELSDAEQLDINEDLIAQARAALSDSRQLELQFSDAS